MQPTFDSPFYRVTAKALVFDDTQRLLVVLSQDGNYELPGGGWEHDEGFEDCLRREITEELGVPLRSIGDVAFMYRNTNKKGYRTLRIAVPAVLEQTEFIIGDDMQEARFVSKAEFLQLDMMAAEGNIAEYADTIWPNS